MYPRGSMRSAVDPYYLVTSEPLVVIQFFILLYFPLFLLLAKTFIIFKRLICVHVCRKNIGPYEEILYHTEISVKYFVTFSHCHSYTKAATFLVLCCKDENSIDGVRYSEQKIIVQ